jgi:hypothetical protein
MSELERADRVDVLLSERHMSAKYLDALHVIDRICSVARETIEAPVCDAFGLATPDAFYGCP